MRIHRLFSAALVAAFALLSACSGDSTAPKPAVVTVDSLLTELNEVTTFSVQGASFGGVPLASASLPVGAACAYNASSQRFDCPTKSSNGVTVNASYRLLDAGGAPQSAFSPTTTAAINTISDVAGTIASPISGSIAITGHSDQTLSGLLTDTRVLNGTSTTAFTMTAAGLTTTMTMAETITNLELPKRGTAGAYPKGTIAMDITSEGATEHITMTFTGTSIVTMTMTSGGTTMTCTFDQAKPSAQPSCH